MTLWCQSLCRNIRCFFWFSAELLGEYIIINSTLTQNRPFGKDRFYFNKLCFSIFIFKTSSKSFLFFSMVVRRDLKFRDFPQLFCGLNHRSNCFRIWTTETWSCLLQQGLKLTSPQNCKINTKWHHKCHHVTWWCHQKFVFSFLLSFNLT